MRKLVNTANHELGGASTSVGTLVKELTRATDRLQETIDVIRSDPSMLLWGRKVPEREMPR
jgi:hypothetical protein